MSVIRNPHDNKKYAPLPITGKPFLIVSCIDSFGAGDDDDAAANDDDDDGIIICRDVSFCVIVVAFLLAVRVPTAVVAVVVDDDDDFRVDNVRRDTRSCSFWRTWNFHRVGIRQEIIELQD